MKAVAILFALLFGATSVPAVVPFQSVAGQSEGHSGTVSGRVTFDGGSAPAELVTSDAVVYLVGDGLEGRPDATQSVLDQSDITFAPHVVTVIAGGKVEIRNSDAIMHNVHSHSRENRPFNKSQLAGMSTTVTLRAPEIVSVTCDVHSQMSAYIAVLPNGFFARPDGTGSYTIDNVPVGTYELVAWHEEYGSVSAPVTVSEGGAVTSDINFTSN
jgi:plastocyanin